MLKAQANSIKIPNYRKAPETIHSVDLSYSSPGFLFQKVRIGVNIEIDYNESPNIKTIIIATSN